MAANPTSRPASSTFRPFEGRSILHRQLTSQGPQIGVGYIIHTDSSPRRQVPILGRIPEYSWQLYLWRGHYGEHGPVMGCEVGKRVRFRAFGFGCRRFDSDPIGTMIIFNTSTLGMYRSLWLSRMRHEWHLHRRQGYTAVDIRRGR